MHLVPAANTYVQVDVLSPESSCFPFPGDSFAGRSVFINCFFSSLIRIQKTIMIASSSLTEIISA